MSLVYPKANTKNNSSRIEKQGATLQTTHQQDPWIPYYSMKKRCICKLYNSNHHHIQSQIEQNYYKIHV